MIQRIAVDMNKKYTQQCNRAIRDLLYMARINVSKVNIKIITKRLNETDYRLICFEENYNTGRSNIYMLYNIKDDTAKGISVRMLIISEQLKVVNNYYMSKEDLNNAYSKTLIDYYLKEFSS